MPAKKKTSTNGTADRTLYIGIDLGTSRSAIVASNGKREWVQSYVGWPKDFVAKKMLGRDVLFGSDALENRLSLRLTRPLEQGVIRDGTQRDEEAVRALVHHLIEQVNPGKATEIYAAVGVPAEALRVNKLAIRNAVKEYADSLMVVSEPFAVAYGLGTLNNALIIDIGAGTADFCIMHGTMPGEEDQRTITVAGDYLDQQLLDRLNEHHPTASFSEVMVRSFKEEYGFVGGNTKRVKVKVPIGGVSTALDVTNDVRAVCEGIVPVLAEATMDLIARYEPDFQEEVKQNVFLAGGGSQIRGLPDALAEELKEFGAFKIRPIDDPLYAGAEGALALAQDMPEEYWEDM
ncbi:MAG: rod shape-determining protein [Rhodothermales bacterium]|nr:rod shape-determining protein [Rhodothermales bacterium]MBO6780550.1 rod shape-determining protein [Rhodothermales bacterium]